MSRAHVATASPPINRAIFGRHRQTKISKALNPGEARFITRVKSSLLTTSPVAAKAGGSIGVVEGKDVFKFANRTTASKFYSSQRLIVQKPFGAIGHGHDVFLIPGTNEMGSGGPVRQGSSTRTAGAAPAARPHCDGGSRVSVRDEFSGAGWST